MFKPNPGMEWETVAAPLVKGLEVKARARLVDPVGLLKAKNVRFPKQGGPEKRNGHEGYPARSLDAYPSGNILGEAVTDPAAPDPFNPNRVQPSNWLYGWGLFDPAVPTITGGTPAYGTGGTGNPGVVSSHPHAGVLFGALGRDNQAAVWDGFRLFPVAEANDRVRPVGAIMPWARTAPIAKTGGSQTRISGADNGTIRCVAWLDGTQIAAQVFDSATGAQLTSEKRFSGFGVVTSMKAVAVGEFLHVYCHSFTLNQLSVLVFHNQSTDWSATISLGTNTGIYDIRAVDAERVLVVKAQTSTDVRARYVTGPGVLGSEMTLNIGAGSADTLLGLAYGVSSNSFCVIMGDGANLWQRGYGATGSPLWALTTVATATIPRATVSDTWFLETGSPKYTIFWEETSGGAANLKQRSFGGASALGGGPISRWHLSLSGQAFRVGERAFVLAAHTSTLQSTWFVLDQNLLPVGRFNVGTAAWQDTWWLHPVGWAGLAPAKDRVVYHMALGAKTRVESPGQSGVFTEPFPVWVTLDFLPPLRHAQAGRAAYIPGAQLWQYDGNQVTEANFPLYPETATLTSSNSTGTLTADGVYTYRIDLCHKNAQGEEVRSASIFHYTNGATSPTALPAGHDTVAIVGRTVPTGLAGSYFLVWRNESEGTLWYLVNSRDPASADYRANDTTTNTWTFTDTVPDSTLISGREIHPAQDPNYVNPFPAPASEVVAGGRSRLWVAGGEVAPGTLAPSRLFAPGERPSFSPVIEVEVDRGVEPVTGIGFVGDITAVFRRTSILAVDSEGPDNILQGAWSVPRALVTDVGALSAESVVRTTAGIMFQSAAGIRMVGPDGGISMVGEAVDDLAGSLNVASTLVHPADHEVRFYGWGGSSLVFAYEQGNWSEWTMRTMGAVRTPDKIVLASPRGQVWVEDADQATDAGGQYEFLIQTGWFGGAGLEGFQRVRRVAAFGEFKAHHVASVRLYYDERDYPDEVFSWDTSGDLVNGAWGDGTWGSGVWGNPNGTGIESLWRWRRRPARQKCSVFSIEMTDNASPNKAFVPVVIGFEYGRRGGIDRIPARTFGG